MDNPTTKICDQCGAEYVPFPKMRNKQRYCSALCRHRSKLPYCRTWHARNKEYANQKAREWHQTNREYAAAKMRERYQANRDQRLANMRQAFQTNRRLRPWRNLLASAKERAAKAGLVFTLTEEWAIERWTGRCEVTNIEFQYVTQQTGSRFYSPSIDQIEAGKGYTPENCRFVLWAINSFKYDGTNSDMITAARAIVSHYGM